MRIPFFTKPTTYLILAFAQATAGMFGSLYFSEVSGFPPCLLCWYQRIAMYPLVAILAAGIYLEDKRVTAYSIPLAVIGLAIATYHNLLSWGIIPEAVAPCRIGVSCLTKYVAYFGFVTIPLLSFLAFGFILACLLMYRHAVRERAASSP